ncbi:MAG TPA: diacylglycerol kinase family protein [Solirubrobacteraceae bacterium]|jgi:diacylglycerol kinase family enzyme|nr:diacylglycerol kinase family protein [Solirubrobacteraceae bacterium]
MADENAEAAIERIFAALEPVADADRLRALVIVNPFATTVSDRLRNLVVHALSARYSVEAVDTQRRGHASELAREAAAEGYDVVIAFGGDGTVNEAANGLAGSSTPLTCLPGGSANVFCKLLGIPAEIVDATEHLLAVADRFAPRLIDLGAVEGRLYTFSAGVGIDAHVVRTVDARPRLKARFGPYFYLAAAVATFARHYAVAAPRMFVSAGGESVAGVTAVIQNAEHYTYWRQRPLDLAAGATLDGGTLSAVVLARASVLGVATLGVRALAGRGGVTRHRQIRALPASTAITVSSSTGRPLPLQVDGDYIGEVTEARFTIRPRALAVVA